MTPDETAIEVLRQYHSITHGREYRPVELGRLISAAIAAERERCIEVMAQSYTTSQESGWTPTIESLTRAIRG